MAEFLSLNFDTLFVLNIYPSIVLKIFSNRSLVIHKCHAEYVVFRAYFLWLVYTMDVFDGRKSSSESNFSLWLIGV